MSEGRRRALEHVCQHRFTLQFVVYGGTVGLVMDVLALIALEPDTSSYTVALLNLPGLLFFVLLAAFFLRKCLSYE